MVTNFSERVVFTGNTLEEVAVSFSQIVKRNYLRNLEHWCATAIDDRDEYFMWQQKMSSNGPDIVAENAKANLLRIMQNPKENKAFLVKQFGLWRSKRWISITRSSGFYNNLLPDENVEHSVAINIEYRIDIQEMTIVERIYSSQYVRL